MSFAKVFGIALFTFLADQASKIYIVQYLNLKERLSIEFLSPIINFKMAWNRGINFGLFGSGGVGSQYVLVVLSVGISIALLLWIKNTQNRLRQVSVALIVGGAFGNAFDRIIFGAVADFLNISCCGVRNPFSFNVADIAIFFGAFALIIWDKGDVGKI